MRRLVQHLRRSSHLSSPVPAASEVPPLSASLLHHPTGITTQQPAPLGGAPAGGATSAAVVGADGLLHVTFLGHGKSAYHPIWLRDHCKCDKCYHAGTKQRLLSTVDIPLDIKIASATLDPGMQSVTLTWVGEDPNHRTTFDLDWLRTHSYHPKIAEESVKFRRDLKYWGAELMANAKDITVPFKDIMNSDEGLGAWLRILDSYGIAYASGVPATPEDTQALGERICFIRETHYGRFWDFTPNLAHGDTAYTTLGLPAHTDTTYFTDPIGLQLFHLLEFKGKGGESLHVDAFNLARQLKETQPWAYDALARILVPAHSAGDGNVTITPTPRSYPILNIDPSTGTLYQIRFNNDDRSTLSGLAPEDVELFYAALREWTRLVKDPKNECWSQMTPGTAVVMDNWRVLHGRSAFTGHRRLTGSYHNWDDYRSRVRELCYGRLGRVDI
ncbi:hypothetical protein HK101_002068 [Irineochytrium annulatum]|nr:hypothetical protein HK101_002068 [Irineochytrium annulatum]